MNRVYGALFVAGQLAALVMVVNWARAWFTGRPRSFVVENVAVAVLIVGCLVFAVLINIKGVGA